MRRRRSRPRFAVLVAAVLTASLMPLVVAPPTAAAATGPSVELPKIPSTPVSPDTMKPQPTDQATLAALKNDQKPGTTPPEGASTPTATSLSPSATWDVSPHTGDFSWSYPLKVPPAPGGLEPQLALAYRSSAVDGRTSVTNNQPSWVGDGWDLSPGFVERAYGSCGDDTTGDVTPPQQVGDLCWRSDNATASYDGGGGTLIRDDDTGEWRARKEDGSRIERLSGAKGVPNGDNDGEHWKITTVDGTQYFFGSEADSKSTWTVPVFGDDTGEQCHGATFDSSHCVQGWRWNLDKVVDRNGNTVRYFYLPENNSYGMNLKDAAVSYVRGGTLDRIDYGLRDGVAGGPTGRVRFVTEDRCVPGSTCTRDKPENWPDVYWEGECSAATCKDKHSPTFFSTKRLDSITTQVLTGGTASDVDRWELDQQYPDPGDGEKAALWLKGITHTGLVGGQLAMPPVTFEGTKYANRVDTIADGVPALVRYRVTGVVSETGGVTTVSYNAECGDGHLPDKDKPETNKLRCFPVRWAKKSHADRTDYFHKYVVSQVKQSDRLSTSTTQATRYEYLDGAAWHFDTSEFMKEDKKTWNEFRGFGRVRVRTGESDDPSGPVTMTEQRFYRGMDGDRKPPGVRSEKVADSEGGLRDDLDWLRGFGFESAQFEREAPSDQPPPPMVSKTITDPVWRGPNAVRGPYESYLVSPGTKRQFTAIASGWGITKTETAYNELGLAEKVTDHGDVVKPDDDRCTTTTYARDPGKWLMNLVSEVESVSVLCGTTPVFPRDALSDTVNTYDGTGNLTKIQVARERPAGDPVYLTASTAEYDVHGRSTSSTDPLGRTSRTTYVPATGGPVTKVVSTSPGTDAVPAGLVTTVSLEPARGATVLVTDPNNRRTESVYDPLGRNTAVWQPNRARKDNPAKPSYAFAYDIRNVAMTAVTSTRIGPKGNEISSRVLYDGFLRKRQTQAPAPGGGRLLTDTRYDSQGRVWKTTQPYFTEATVDSTLWVAADESIPGLSRNEYDGAGRTVATAYHAGATERWRTTTKYDGDRVQTIPPEGGVVSTAISDAQGRIVELRQHRSRTAPGSYDATKYTYNRAGQQETLTNAAGDVWRYTYDLLGNQTVVEDPAVGVTTKTYDAAGQLLTERDPAGTTLAYSYDTLGRTTARFDGRVGGTKLAEWTYDTVELGKGQEATSTRWVGDKAYRSSILSYNQSYQPTGASLEVPETELPLAGAYKTFSRYNPDGSLAAETYAAAGDVPSETVTYGYDDLGMLAKSSAGFDGTTDILVGLTEYTKYGELARLHLGADTRHTWLSFYRDSNTRRLSRSIVDAEVPSPLQSDVNYTYNPAGLITSIADKSTAAEVQCFRYDHVLQLSEAWTPGTDCQADPGAAGLGGPAPYWHSYRYDVSGNRTSEVRHAAAGDTTRTYTHEVPGHANALGSVTTTGPGVSTVDAFGYDLAGKTISRKVGGVERTLNWTPEGNLAKSTQGTKESKFVYDAGGGRLLRDEPDSVTLYLGNQEVRYNKQGGGPEVTRYYGFGGKTIAMRKDRGALTWLANDHQATSDVAIDSGTLAVTRRRQLPFGEARGPAVTWPGERGFVGGTKDSGTGLTHLGAREYDPSLGRFISVDPVLDAGDPQQINGYSYGNNSPISSSDPSGMIATNCPDGECKGGQYQPGKGPASTYNPPVNWGPPAPVVGASVTYTGVQKMEAQVAASRAQKSKPVTECAVILCSEVPSWVGTPDACIGGGGLFDTASISSKCYAAQGRQDANKKLAEVAATPKPSQPFDWDKALPHYWVTPIAAMMLGPIMLPVAVYTSYNGPPSGTTVSICGGGGAWALAGVSAEMCLSEDKKGAGISTSVKPGVSIQAGLFASSGVKLSQGSIEDLGGTGGWVGYGFRRLPIGIEKAWSSDGKWSYSVSTSRGITVGGGPEVGGEIAHSMRFKDFKMPDMSFFSNVQLSPK